jgi:hypothetical protein
MIDGRPLHHVWTVHATRHDEIGAVEMIFADLPEAVAYAVERSMDTTVLSTSVTRYTLAENGTRTSVAWYVDGQRQEQRGRRPGRIYPVDVGA